MSTFTTRTEAIENLIVDAIEAGDARADEFDVEAIADQVLAAGPNGYAFHPHMTEGEFWGIVSQNPANNNVEDADLKVAPTTYPVGGTFQELRGWWLDVAEAHFDRFDTANGSRALATSKEYRA